MLFFKIAIRNIFRQKRRSFLTGLSMTLGFVMAAFTFGMVEGSYGNIINIFTSDKTGHVQIHAEDYLERPSIYKQIRNVDEVLTNVRAVDGVIAAAPRIFAPSLAYKDNKNTIANVVGIDPEAEQETTTIDEKAIQGTFLTGAMNEDGYDVIMVGYSVAQSLKLEVGDELILIGQGVDGSIANDIYIVGSIIGSKTTSEAQMIFMSLDAARRYLSMGPSAHEIAVITDSPKSAEALALRIQTALTDERLHANPWQVVEETFYNTMKADKEGNQVTTIIIMSMIAIGVLNAVLMSVLERTREFGLLRAVGTRPRNVFWLIIIETLVLGFLSSLVGLAVSWPLLAQLSETGIPMPNPVDVGGMSFDTIMTEVSAFTLLAPGALVLGTCLIVSLWPAVRSARVTPIQALQAV